MKRLLRNITDVCDYFGADSPAGLNRRVYKDTDCGASISVHLNIVVERCDSCVKYFERFSCGARVPPFECDCPTCQGFCLCQTWVHNGRAYWDLVNDESAIGFTIQTIVEGSEATVNSDEFGFPCKVKDLKAWMVEMEAEADRIWHEDNEINDERDDAEENA